MGIKASGQLIARVIAVARHSHRRLGFTYVSRHPRTNVATLVAALLVGVSSFCVISVAASNTVPATSVGFDISFPQCAGALPAAPGYGIVGVNSGKNFTINKCLARELQWAQNAGNGAPGFYLNSGNPGPLNDAAWPTSQTTPKVCSGANSAPCAFDYGWNAAHASYGAAIAAEATNGAPSPASAATSASWWLDVEVANPWEARLSSYGATAASHVNDQASLLGMAAYLKGVGVKSVGIYTGAAMWQSIMGATASTFAAFPLWIPGPATLVTAQDECSAHSFLGGRIGIVQYPSLGYDGDYTCGLLSAPITASVSVSATSTVSNQIVVTNNEGAVTFAQATGAPALLVNATGLVTASGPVAVGTYSATGTTTDSAGNTGTFSFTLEAGVLTQAPPTIGAVKVSGSAKFSTQLAIANGVGSVTFTQTTGTPALKVSATGLITPSGALAVGVYHATGTTSDASGDAGTFSFTLSVGTIVERPPLTASVAAGSSATYSHLLVVGANLGPVTFVQTHGLPTLVVSSTGLVTTNGVLTKGIYFARGTDSDATGDRGTFAFTLTVTGAVATTTTTMIVSSTSTTVPLIPVATRVIGRAVAGRSRTLVIVGHNFYGRPTITSHAGTVAIVTRDSGNRLVVVVDVRARSRKGVFTFTLTFSGGQNCTVRYHQS